LWATKPVRIGTAVVLWATKPVSMQ
jgi:hypothetical protein